MTITSLVEGEEIKRQKYLITNLYKDFIKIFIKTQLNELINSQLLFKITRKRQRSKEAKEATI